MRAGHRVRGRGPAVAVLALLVLAALTSTAWAAFSTGGGGWARARSTVLQPPTGLSVAETCTYGSVPTFRSAATASGTGSGNLSIGIPAGVVAGDLLLAVVSVRAAGPLPIPSGWTSVLQDGDSSTLTTRVYRRTATASEPTSYSWGAFSAPAAGAISAYTSVDTVTPVEPSAGALGARSRTIVAPSVTTTAPNVRLVGLFSIGFGDGTPITADAAMARRWNVQSSASGANTGQVTVMGADQAWPTAGSTGTRTSTSSGSGVNVGQVVALRPPATVVATTTWTPSTSTFASGQLFERSTGATLQRSASLSTSTTSQVDDPLTSGASYTVSVRATAGNWRSPAATSTFTARPC